MQRQTLQLGRLGHRRFKDVYGGMSTNQSKDSSVTVVADLRQLLES